MSTSSLVRNDRREALQEWFHPYASSLTVSTADLPFFSIGIGITRAIRLRLRTTGYREHSRHQEYKYAQRISAQSAQEILLLPPDYPVSPVRRTRRREKPGRPDDRSEVRSSSNFTHHCQVERAGSKRDLTPTR